MNYLASNPATNRAIGYVILPRNLRIGRKVAVRGERFIHVIRDLPEREIPSHIRLVQCIDDIASDEVEEDEIDSLR